ncbi:MAG: ExeM/NucH family extracellular endonuclease [Gammaproteobacteria bacterium]|nr:ExeM/NucH family extracellular endonuclease [Gammaproteobacteria bacterium]
MTKKWITKSIFSIVSALFCLSGHVSAASDLFISEYIEGSSNNKALEFYNGTANSIDLSAYEVQFYFNGSTTAGHTIDLNGVVSPGKVFVLAHVSADAAVLANTNQTSAGSWFNGNDAVVLLNGGAGIDAIGQIGVDPESQWGSGLISTRDNTLRRKATVATGDTDAVNLFDPTLEWDGFAQNTFDGLGGHTNNDGGTIPTPPPEPTGQLVINEVDADTANSDSAEFIELYDGGTGNQDLSDFVVVLYNGKSDTVYASYNLDGMQTNAAGYFVLGNAAVPGVGLILPNRKLQNGADAVALYQINDNDDDNNFPNGSAVSLLNLVDAIVYDTNDAADAGLLTLLNSGEPQLNEDGNGNKNDHSNQRCANGAGGPLNSSGFQQAIATPGQANACVINTACGSAATLIHSIQGNTDTSPVVGQVMTVEAVVVGNFQDTVTGLSGFFVQEQTADMDADDLTSEGLFVFDNGFGVNVATGNVVRVTGTVTEHFGLTELNTVSSVEVCATGVNLPAEDVTLPFASMTMMERYEGMLIHLQQTLTVTDNFNLGRFGEVTVSSGGRLFIPTNIVSPGASANTLQAANDLNQIVIDDGNSAQNPDPIVYPTNGLTAFNTLRNGDTVKNVTGVVTYTAGTYRVHPTQTPEFVTENPRTTAPALPGAGSLRVASFNVLNYFNGDGQGGGYPTARGADTATEFNRQSGKIIAALSAMQADIIGLMELENDGYGANSAIQDLVNGLNAAAPVGTSYRFINPGVSQIGTDAIAVGLIYRNETVQAEGTAAILDSSIDARFNDQMNRPTLAQTFIEVVTGGRLTVAVNHLKSKGSSCASIGDPGISDGQGNCNLTRTSAAEAMMDWLAGDPTGSDNSNVLIIGDLNAYAKEDPVSAILAAGYSNLIATRMGSEAYSFVFRGQSGNLDHALASPSLTTQVTGVTDWHINADEPNVLDYNMEFKSSNQLANLYNSDAYRASDHDPVVVELNLMQ